MPGPPKKPAEIVMLEGNPGKRAINTNAPKTGDLQNVTPPKHLSKIAADLWRTLAPALCRMHILQIGDAPAFEMMCECYSTVRALRNEPEERRTMFMAMEKYLKFAQQFGLTPSARLGLSVPDPKSIDAGEAWFARKGI